MIIHSWGGGTQSIAIAVLIFQNKLKKPDHIVFADTGREASETMIYFNKWLKPIFDKEKMHLLIADHSYSTVDLKSKSGKVLMPVYQYPNGKLKTYCSNEWKQRVIRRYLRKVLKVNKCKMWLGFSIDEIERMKDSGVKWITNDYPLIEMGITREECKNIVIDYGLPKPPRSSCWCCPHRTNQEWSHLKENFPDDFRKAIDLDEDLSKDSVYLHRSRTRLKEADLTNKNKKEETTCQESFCFT